MVTADPSGLVLRLGLAICCAGALLSGCISTGEDVDARASQLIEALGPLCESFDYLSKEDGEAGTLRPVQCEPPDSDKPQIMLLVFESPSQREDAAAEWTKESSKLVGADRLVIGDHWMAETTAALAGDVAGRLDGELASP